MHKVRKVTTPSEYLNKRILDRVDFSDMFVTTNREDDLRTIAELVFNNPNRWVRGLFRLRNKLVSIFGLKTDVPADYNDSFAVGGYIGFFKIFSITENELVLGANDSHLNFRAIVANNHLPTYNIQIITLVRYNNIFGKLYMGIIKPFHFVVVKQMVGKAFKNPLS